MPSSWPSRRALDTFDRWLEWCFHSVVVDLSDGPLLRETLRPARVPALGGLGDGLSFWTVRRAHRLSESEAEGVVQLHARPGLVIDEAVEGVFLPGVIDDDEEFVAGLSIQRRRL